MVEIVSSALAIRHEQDPAFAIRQRVKDKLPSIKIGGADVLIAVWRPEKDAKTAGGIILVEKTKDEYRFQGVTGLVLALGPLAYKSERTSHWFVDDDGNPEPPARGEWWSFNFKQGEAFLLGDQPCRLVNDQYLLMRVPSPDWIA